MTLAELIKHERDRRKLDAALFANVIGVTLVELQRLETGESSVSNDRAEYWAQLLKVSRVDLVQSAIRARDSGAPQLVEGLARYIHRKV